MNKYFLVCFFLAPLFAIAFESAAFSELRNSIAENGECDYSQEWYRLYSFIFIIYSFVNYSQVVNHRRRNNKPEKLTIFFISYFILMDTIYISIKVIQFAICGFWTTFEREAVNTWINYPLNDLVIALGLHSDNLKISFSTLHWVVFLVLFQIGIFWNFNQGLHSFLIFNYFNIKLSIVIFEIGWNGSTENLLSDKEQNEEELNSLGVFFFLLFLFCKLLKQLYYSIPLNIRDDNWDISSMFWIATGLETIILIILLGKIWKDRRGGEGSQKLLKENPQKELKE